MAQLSAVIYGTDFIFSQAVGLEPDKVSSPTSETPVMTPATIAPKDVIEKATVTGPAPLTLLDLTDHFVSGTAIPVQNAELLTWAGTGQLAGFDGPWRVDTFFACDGAGGNRLAMLEKAALTKVLAGEGNAGGFGNLILSTAANPNPLVRDHVLLRAQWNLDLQGHSISFGAEDGADDALAAKSIRSTSGDIVIHRRPGAVFTVLPANSGTLAVPTDNYVEAWFDTFGRPYIAEVVENGVTTAGPFTYVQAVANGRP